MQRPTSQYRVWFADSHFWRSSWFVHLHWQLRASYSWLSVQSDSLILHWHLQAVCFSTGTISLPAYFILVPPVYWVLITWTKTVSCSTGWQLYRSLVQHPPQRSIRVHDGKNRTVGSLLIISCTVCSSGMHLAATALVTASLPKLPRTDGRPKCKDEINLKFLNWLIMIDWQLII